VRTQTGLSDVQEPRRSNRPYGPVVAVFGRHSVLKRLDSCELGFREARIPEPNVFQ
jgi:hypothetical protein